MSTDHFDFECVNCHYQLKQVTHLAVRDVSCARCQAPSAFVQQLSATAEQMRGISQLYSSPIPSWQWDFPTYGCRMHLFPEAKNKGLRLSFDTNYKNPFVDLSRESIISLASYLVSYLEQTQEKP